MRLMFSRWEAPLRLSSGAFILQQGLEKRGVPEEAAQGLHGMAQPAELPYIENMDPKQFVDLVSAAEIALGGALLAPFVPRRLAGLGLLAFSGSLLRLYWKTPGMRQEGSVAPTPEGVPLAKDVWLLAIGLALALSSSRRKERAVYGASG